MGRCLSCVKRLVLSVGFLIAAVRPVTAEWETSIFFEGKMIKDIAIDGSGTVWVSVNYEVYRLVDGIFERVIRGDGAKAIAKSFHVDDQGSIWLVASPIWKYDGYEWTQFGNAEMYTECIETTSDGKIWAGSYDKGLMHYDGELWTQYTIEDGLPSNQISSIAIDDNGIIWIGSFSPILTSYDGEKFYTYSSLAGIGNLEVSSMIIDSKQRLWISSQGGLIVKTYDDWIVCNSQIYNDFSEAPDGKMHSAWGYVIDTYPDHKYFGGVNSIDPGNNFSTSDSRFKSDSVCIATNSIAFDNDGNFWLGSFEGLVRYGITTMVENKNIDSVQSIFISNYPNPFNMSTIIIVLLPSCINTNISVYNITGQKVYTFQAVELHQGDNRVEWLGINDNGDLVSTGMYFIKLSVDDKSYFHKMFLLK